MFQKSKCAPGHPVLKKEGRLKPRDLGGQPLRDSKMPGLPGNLVIQLQQAGRSPGDNALAGVGGGLQVSVDAQRQVKANRRRSVDPGCDGQTVDFDRSTMCEAFAAISYSTKAVSLGYGFVSPVILKPRS